MQPDDCDMTSRGYGSVLWEPDDKKGRPDRSRPHGHYF
jgi:hypothetical protein